MEDILNSLINTDGKISSIALSCFAIIIAGLAWTLVQVYRIKSAARDARVAAAEAANNTTNVSNGFAREVRSNLKDIIRTQDDIQKSINDHLRWHLENGDHG